MSITSRKQWLALLPTLSICYSSALYAGDHGAHEHGVGQLNIAIEAHQLHIELTSPAMNIVGFEHQPRDGKQHAMVDKAVTKLKAADQLFITSAAASCVLREATVESGLIETHDDHEHHDHGHKEHGHNETHADFSANYQFECAKPEQLSEISVMFFEAFPATDELRVQALKGAKQLATELSPGHSKIEF